MGKLRPSRGSGLCTGMTVTIWAIIRTKVEEFSFELGSKRQNLHRNCKFCISGEIPVFLLDRLTVLEEGIFVGGKPQGEGRWKGLRPMLNLRCLWCSCVCCEITDGKERGALPPHLKRGNWGCCRSWHRCKTMPNWVCIRAFMPGGLSFWVW